MGLERLEVALDGLLDHDERLFARFALAHNFLGELEEAEYGVRPRGLAVVV